MNKSPAGYGLCGCERPDLRHDKRCLWGLGGKRGRKRARKARAAGVVIAPNDRVIDLAAPRPGACWVCFRPLDDDAREAGDTRCTACYRAIGERRRQSWLGDAQ